jgi:biopolymer transport protein ExbD
MSKGGVIIRLIDVAMNILFAFIVISDLKVQAQIKLPANEEQPQPQPQTEPTLIHVQIDLDNSFLIKRNDVVVATTSNLVELERLLVELAQETPDSETIVLIEPHPDSVMQRTVDVMDICERNQIAMNINYESMEF